MVLSFRVLLACFLILLAVAAQRMPPMVGLFAMVLFEAGFFAGMRSQLDADSPNWLAVSYALFPFALAAQLAILPLSLMRGFLLCLPALGLLSALTLLTALLTALLATLAANTAHTDRRVTSL